jgi:hypothetical protein
MKHILRSVENDRIYVFKRWVWAREESVWWERCDSDVVCNKLVISPIAARLGRSNELTHNVPV